MQWSSVNNELDQSFMYAVEQYKPSTEPIIHIIWSRKYKNKNKNKNKTVKDKGLKIGDVSDYLFWWFRSFCDLIRSLSRLKECCFHVNHLYL